MDEKRTIDTYRNAQCCYWCTEAERPRKTGTPDTEFCMLDGYEVATTAVCDAFRQRRMDE